jgi:hypothetical protein
VTFSVPSFVKRTALALAVALSVFLGAALVAPAPASAVGGSKGAVTVNCSWGSCSYYLSRSATKEVNARIDSYLNAGTALSSGVVCVAIGAATAGLGGVICGVGVALAGADAAMARVMIKEAAETHGSRGACFKITRSHIGTRWYSTNNGKFCKD